MKHHEQSPKTRAAKTGLSATLRAFLPGAKGSGAFSAPRARAAALASVILALALTAAPAVDHSVPA